MLRANGFALATPHAVRSFGFTGSYKLITLFSLRIIKDIFIIINFKKIRDRNLLRTAVGTIAAFSTRDAAGGSKDSTNLFDRSQFSFVQRLKTLLAAGKLSVGDYHKMKGLLANIMELADKRLAPEAPGAEAGGAPDGD